MNQLTCKFLDYMSATPSPGPSRSPPPPASSPWQCSHPDLNCKLRMAVFPTRPQPQASAWQCSLYQTSTASFRMAVFPTRPQPQASAWQCSLPDLDRELPMAVFPPGPQLNKLPRSVIYRTSTASSRWHCSHPDLNWKSHPTASCRWQLSHPDLNCRLRTAVFPPRLNRELPMAVFPTRPQPQAPDSSVPHRTWTFQNLCQIECQKLLCQI